MVTKAPLGPRAPPREAVALCVAARVRLTEGRCRPGVSLGIDLASVRRVFFSQAPFPCLGSHALAPQRPSFFLGRVPSRVPAWPTAVRGQRRNLRFCLRTFVSAARSLPTTRGMAQPQTVKGVLPLRWCPPQPRRGTTTLSGDSLLPAANRLPCTAHRPPRPRRTPCGEPPSSELL